MKSKNIEESLRVARRPEVAAQRRQCFANAFRLVMDVPGYADATYVEGIVVRCGVCMEHGWVEKDGQVVDPTLPEEDIVYFSGLRFEGQRALSKAMIEIPREEGCEDLPLFYRFGWGGSESPEFCGAWEDALAYKTGAQQSCGVHPEP
jgi:hypothetical protein